MGGDCIGSDLVPLSTGVDFVKSVIRVARGTQPDIQRCERQQAAGNSIYL